ncbi:hypothetical protein D3C81_1956220 [compost metagenome]
MLGDVRFMAILEADRFHLSENSGGGIIYLQLFCEINRMNLSILKDLFNRIGRLGSK